MSLGKIHNPYNAAPFSLFIEFRASMSSQNKAIREHFIC